MSVLPRAIHISLDFFKLNLHTHPLKPMGEQLREDSQRTLAAVLDLSPPNYKAVFSGMVQIIILKAWKHVCLLL